MARVRYISYTVRSSRLGEISYRLDFHLRAYLQIQMLGYFFARDLIISGTYDHGMKKNNPMR